ncbi:MAG TPA: acyltransferase [Parvularcula sp.]|nr:acyltransferase [Parvularcula sp.]
MTARFDIDAVKAFVGDKVFARGEAYWRDGLVAIIDMNAARVRAQVSGTENYRTTVTGRGAEIGGDCSCPAFSDFGPCKHIAATALAANDGAAKGGGDALTRIRAHLETKDVAALVDILVDLAERDPAIFQRLDLAAAASTGDAATLESRLKKAIDSATRTGRFIDYRAAGGWAGEVDSALDALEAIASGRTAPIAMRLALHAITRIEKAIGHMDDSDGHCSDLMARAAEIHLRACRDAKPERVDLARTLYAREMEEEYDVFSDAAATYTDVLGEKGLAEYRRLAEAAFGKLPPCGRKKGYDQERSRLSHMMDYFAELAGDLDTRIAIREADQSSHYDVLRLAEFCLEHGREDEALRRAEEGLWLFEDERPDDRLYVFVARLLGKKGRKEEAVAHLMRAFDKAPSLTLHESLKSAGGAKASKAAIAKLRSMIASSRQAARDARSDLLIEILMAEGQYEDAWVVLRERGAGARLALRLAEKSEKSHPAEAIAAYHQHVESLLRMGGNRSYDEAAKHIARLASLQNAATHAAYLDDLRTRHKAKRNFIRLLR